MKADRALAGLRASASEATLRAPEVSGWSVGEHVHHCALGMIGICNAVLASSPPPPPARFSLARSFVLVSGRIPRGRGKAPDGALPSPDVGTAELQALLDEAEHLIGRVAEADRNQWWEHFIFGVMDRDQVLRFIGIHNRHHLRIISDVRTAAD